MSDPIPKEKKPPVPVQYSKKRRRYCSECDGEVSHMCTPWIVINMRGEDNMVQRCICTMCHHWHKVYRSAAIMKTNPPTKRKYDRIAHVISLEEIISQFEKEEK